MEENNTMGMLYDVDVTTLAAALPEPTIVMTGKESYSIADTADYPLMELNLYGKSTQDGTPTPEAPVDIISVGDDGNLSVTACGKNLVTHPYYSGASLTSGGITFAVNNDGSITINGTATAYATFFPKRQKRQ